MTKNAMMTKFLPKILLKKFEHHSERWETTEKACNNDEIPPKDLVEEGWASFITLRDHWQSLQWWRNFSQRSCWVELTSDKDSNDDKIPPKDLFEEVWASFRTLRDHCRLCQWSLKVLNDALSHQPDKSCWRWLELVPKRSVVYSTNLTKAVSDDWSWSQNVLMFALFHQPPAADLDLPLPPLITSLNVLTDALSHQPVKSSWRWSRLESSITCW